MLQIDEFLGLSVFFSAWCSIWRVVRVVGRLNIDQSWPFARHWG